MQSRGGSAIFNMCREVIIVFIMFQVGAFLLTVVVAGWTVGWFVGASQASLSLVFALGPWSWVRSLRYRAFPDGWG